MPSWNLRWFSQNDTPDERRLIMKLDLILVPYLFVAYWVKYVDQSNLNNAYVSGLREDLQLFGNELVHLQTMYTVGAVVGQLPFIFLLTRVPLHWLLPALDLSWGLFTLLQYRAQSYAELMAYRFLVGWFEAAFYPIVNYIFGSWYRVDETGRRGGLFYIGSTLGAMTAGFLQAAASRQLDGVNGLAGWRWMYIICSVITMPVGIIGLCILPGTPDKPNRWVLKQKEIDVAVERLQKAGHETVETFSFASLRKVASRPQVWTLLLIDIFFWNSGVQGSGAFLLWLRSLNRFSTSRLNEIGAAQPAAGMFYTLFICFASDLFLGPRNSIILAQTWNAIGLIILTIWNVPESAKWFAFLTNNSASAMASVLYGWINHALKESPAERSAAIVALSAVAQSTTAWTPLLTFKTVEGPRYPKGYAFALANSLCVILASICLDVYSKRKNSKIVESEDDEESIPTESESIQPNAKNVIP